MRVAILQPSYLPWLGHLEQFDYADLFIFLNDVQYTKNDWRNRNRIKGPQGPAWLTVPVRRLGLHQAICDAQIDYTAPWADRHLRLLWQYYRQAPYYEAVVDLLRPRLLARPMLLQDLTIPLTLDLAAYLGCETETIRSTELGVDAVDPNDRLVALCRRVGATEFYEGAAGQSYLDVPRFEAAGVRVVFQSYQHPTYRQSFPPFVSHLSVVDLLCHYGPEALAVLRAGHGTVADAAQPSVHA
jgi:hypothetical protein